jgi:hypothetical protein
MKFNKWTVGLASVGLVSLASAAKAEEKANMVQTALSYTSLSGYVDTSAQWNFGTGNGHMPPYKFGGTDKADGFNLNGVQLRIEKPLDESSWAAGYRADLWFGPDANTLGTQSTLATGSSDFALRQAYIALRAPLGNGLDFKFGVWDSIIGYESVESPSNPNYTRSYGHSIEPQTHTGLLVSYRINDAISLSGGIANTMNSAINSRAQGGSLGTPSGVFSTLFPAITLANTGDNQYAESYKAYMGSIALTAPDSMGFLAGSTLYGGVVNGYNNSVLGTGVGLQQLNAYAGATLATPVTGLRLGAAFDLLDIETRNFHGTGPLDGLFINGEIWTVAGYVSYQATEKLGLHARVEYVDAMLDQPLSGHQNLFALTTTAQYDLWKNVTTRLEFRWDHSTSGTKIFGGDTFEDAPNRKNAYMLAANIIYKF